MAVSFVDNKGERQQVDLVQFNNPMYIHRVAADEKLTVRQYLNRQYPTLPGDPDAFSQMCASAGLRFRADESLGIPAANLQQMLNPLAVNQTGGTITNFPAVPDSRILFPPALMEAVNAALDSDTDPAVAAFENLIGSREVIAGDRFEQPVIKFDGKKGPEDSTWQRAAQNAPPPVMLGITASDIARTIPSYTIGMQISNKALANNSLDLVARTLTRFYKRSGYTEWLSILLKILNGDPSATNTPMSAAKSALAQTKVNTLDATITANGIISQLAWNKIFYRNSMKMTKTDMVMDYATLMAIENRVDRPTNVQNNSTDRIDTPFRIAYPAMPDTISFIIMPDDAGWPANTIMSLDRADALFKVTSSSADYEASENLIMLKTTQLRFDKGSLVGRMYDESFDVYSLTI